ncbi:ATP-binding protein [Dietzia sp. SL131]|uniref:sensor histidine kinase n=1 Tax=Dietzia sp. SL131 TaxID=2995149 RepID=UPI00227BA37A|nr:ATP-binding protein [Dietzia sp. SL131]MCY1658251.1 ATP-binding protein [Dietzia sp. SL131]
MTTSAVPPQLLSALSRALADDDSRRRFLQDPSDVVDTATALPGAYAAVAVDAAAAAARGGSAIPPGAAALLALGRAFAHENCLAGIDRLSAAAGIFLPREPDLATRLVALRVECAEDEDTLIATLAYARESVGFASSALARAAARASARKSGIDGLTARCSQFAETGLDHGEAFADEAIVELVARGRHDAAEALADHARQSGLDLDPDTEAHLLPEECDFHDPRLPAWAPEDIRDYNRLVSHELGNVIYRLETALSLITSRHDRLACELGAASAEAAELLARAETAGGRATTAVTSLRALNDKLRSFSSWAEPTADAGGCDAVEIADDVVASLTDRAAVQGTEVVVRHHVGVHPRIAVPAPLVWFVLHGLVDNALKAHARTATSKVGEEHARGTDRIVVHVAYDRGGVADRERAPDGWTLMAVEDDGDGIPSELPPSVLSWDQQGIPGTPTGSGLGLSAASDIVRRHGGSLTAARQAIGSIFRLRLPAAPSTPCPPHPEETT